MFQYIIGISTIFRALGVYDKRRENFQLTHLYNNLLSQNYIAKLCIQLRGFYNKSAGLVVILANTNIFTYIQVLFM
jgi:hypothetical protein